MAFVIDHLHLSPQAAQRGYLYISQHRSLALFNMLHARQCAVPLKVPLSESSQHFAEIETLVHRSSTKCVGRRWTIAEVVVSALLVGKRHDRRVTVDVDQENGVFFGRQGTRYRARLHGNSLYTLRMTVVSPTLCRWPPTSLQAPKLSRTSSLAGILISTIDSLLSPGSPSS